MEERPKQLGTDCQQLFVPKFHLGLSLPIIDEYHCGDKVK